MGQVQCLVVVQNCFKCFSMRVQHIFILIMQYLSYLLSDLQTHLEKTLKVPPPDR